MFFVNKYKKEFAAMIKSCQIVEYNIVENTAEVKLIVDDFMNED